MCSLHPCSFESGLKLSRDQRCLHSNSIRDTDNTANTSVKHFHAKHSCSSKWLTLPKHQAHQHWLAPHHQMKQHPQQVCCNSQLNNKNAPAATTCSNTPHIPLALLANSLIQQGLSAAAAVEALAAAAAALAHSTHQAEAGSMRLVSSSSSIRHQPHESKLGCTHSDGRQHAHHQAAQPCSITSVLQAAKPLAQQGDCQTAAAPRSSPPSNKVCTVHQVKGSIRGTAGPEQAPMGKQQKESVQLCCMCYSANRVFLWSYLASSDSAAWC